MSAAGPRLIDTEYAALHNLSKKCCSAQFSRSRRRSLPPGFYAHDGPWFGNSLRPS